MKWIAVAFLLAAALPAYAEDGGSDLNMPKPAEIVGLSVTVGPDGKRTSNVDPVHPEWFGNGQNGVFKFALQGVAAGGGSSAIELGMRGCIVGPFEFVMGGHDILSIPPGERVPAGCK